MELDPTNRIDRLRAMGNAVVPVCAAMAFVELYERLTEGETER